MQLSDQQRAQITSWLEARKLVANCPMCADIAWNFTDILLGVTSSPEGERQMSQTAHPMIQAVCTNCGHVRLFSARVMALVP
jgi:hypothetical protein